MLELVRVRRPQCHDRRAPLGGRVAEFSLRVSPRARRARIVVDPRRGVEVVAPPWTGRAEAEALVARHAGWIERQLDRLRPRVALAPISERDGRRLAREVAGELCREHARPLEVTYARIRIADQRTRWGSCSARGTLSFNWRLVLAPPGVFAYVAVHELCHLREPSHAPAFWRLVSQARPGYRTERAWLREHGPALLAYEPVP